MTDDLPPSYCRTSRKSGALTYPEPLGPPRTVAGILYFTLHYLLTFIDSFMDDVTYVRDVEVRVERMICYIPGCICYGSENFGLGSLHDDYVVLAGAFRQLYSVAPYRFDYRSVDE